MRLILGLEGRPPGKSRLRETIRTCVIAGFLFLVALAPGLVLPTLSVSS